MSFVIPHSTNKLTVLYDSRGFKMEFGGVSRYYFELIQRLPDDVERVLAIRRTRNRLLQAEPFLLPPLRKEYSGADFDRVVLHGRHLPGINRFFRLLRRVSPTLVHADERANERYAIHLARQRDIDLIHLTEAHYFNYKWQKIVRRKPFVVTVVDLIPELLFGDVNVRKNRRPVLEQASGIIAISQYTKDRIINEYGINEGKIKVIHLGSDSLPPTGDASLFPGKRYLLYVGRRKERADYKNFPFFVNAIAPMLTAIPDLYLVCTGAPFGEYESTLFQKAGIEGKVLHHFADDKSLYSLFAHAEAFIYPSKMEGFGIPILDAFEVGCPVVLSNCSCFPEIAGDAALYFNDGEVEGLQHVIQTILERKPIRDDLIMRGKLRAKHFSWEKCAKSTAEYYKEVLSK